MIRDQILAQLDAAYSLLDHVPESALYAALRPEKKQLEPPMVGVCLLRSASAIEQVMGGLTRRLWDDPYEWTLPEALPTRHDVRSYISEIKGQVETGFTVLSSDDDLTKLIPAPQELMPVGEVLFTALRRSASSYGKALCLLELWKLENKSS